MKSSNCYLPFHLSFAAAVPVIVDFTVTIKKNASMMPHLKIKDWQVNGSTLEFAFYIGKNNIQHNIF